MKKLAILCLAALLLAATGLAEGERVALLCGPVGDSPFLTGILEKTKELQETFGYELLLTECEDDAAWQAARTAALEAPCELVIGVGERAADLAGEGADGVSFAVIGADGGEGAASWVYSDEQSAYVLGVMAAAALPGAERFGFLGRREDDASFPIRWGFAEGVRSVRPGAEIAFAWTGDGGAAAARSLALELRDGGCAFVFGGAGADNAGLFQAAAELAGTGSPLYVTGQDADATDPDNPCVLSGQLRSGEVAALVVADNFYAGTLEPGLTVLDMASGAIGVTHVTTGGSYRNEAVLTDGVLDACRAAADAIASGELTLRAPEPGDYEF